MKRGKNVYYHSINTWKALCIITWVRYRYLGRRPDIIDKNPSKNPASEIYIYSYHHKNRVIWKVGAYAKFTLP